MKDMFKVKVRNIVVGDVMTNCYICSNIKTNESVIIDPGDDAKAIITLIDSLGCRPAAIFLTHGHFDHILAVRELKEHYPVKVYAYKDESELLQSESMNLSIYHGSSVRVVPDILLNDGEYITAAAIEFKVIHTPGHTSGSCCYLVESEKILFSGDTMFYRSHGRTDFVTGSESRIIRSIKEKLLTLDGDTVVYPGHDISTTIGDERLMY